MNRFKTFFRRAMPALMLGLALAALPARAQFFGGQYGFSQFVTPENSIYGTNVWANTNIVLAISSGTNFVLPCGTNATTSAVQVYNGHTIALTVRAFGVTNAASFNVSVPFALSIDGCNWDPAFTNIVISPAAAGSSAQKTISVDIGSIGWICPWGFTNAASISNLFIGYAIKPGY